MARFSPLVMIRSVGSVVAVCGLVLAAGAWSDPASAAQRAASAPYTVVIDDQLTGSTGAGAGGAQPEAFSAFKAAMAGKGVTVDICDNKGTTTGNIDCEHQAVSDHAAVFTPLNANLDQSVVDEAGIPVVGVANDTAPQSFDISAQQGLFVGMGVALAKRAASGSVSSSTKAGRPPRLRPPQRRSGSRSPTPSSRWSRPTSRRTSASWSRRTCSAWWRPASTRRSPRSSPP